MYLSTLDASLSLASSDTITTNNYVELDTIVGGETIIFTIQRNALSMLACTPEPAARRMKDTQC